MIHEKNRVHVREQQSEKRTARGVCVTAWVCPESCTLPLSWGFEGPVTGVARQDLKVEAGQLQTYGPLGVHPIPTGSRGIRQLRKGWDHCGV